MGNSGLLSEVGKLDSMFLTREETLRCDNAPLIKYYLASAGRGQRYTAWVLVMNKFLHGQLRSTAGCEGLKQSE